MTVGFPAGMVERVRAAAVTEGMTAPAWVCQRVDRAFAVQRECQGDPDTIAGELERLARRLRGWV